jgi:tetratricopeptide (TPR) repeat protein
LESGASKPRPQLAIHRDTGERIEEGRTLANIALLDQAAGRVEAARSNFFAALAITRDASSRIGEGVVLGTWALWRARTDSSTRRAGTTTRRSPSIAPSAIGAAKAGCSRTGGPARATGRDDEAFALAAQAEVHLRAIGETLDLAELLCLRGRLELAAGEHERARRSLEEANAGAEALDLDPARSCRSRSPSLRQAIDTARPTAR